MALRLRPLHETFGAEVAGVDLSREVDAATFAEIEAAWQENLIARGRWLSKYVPESVRSAALVQ